jgi:hypothetical protein
MIANPDEDILDVMEVCRALKVSVHVRGTDANPKIELRCKFSRRIVGGIELKERIRRYGRQAGIGIKAQNQGALLALLV